MKHTYSASCSVLEIRPLQKEDLETLRCWRNNAKISAYLRKIDYITQEQQILWYENYLKLSNIYFWSILKRKTLIGALSIYDVSEKSSEIGKIMIGSETERGKGYGYTALIMTLAIGFQKLNFDIITLKVHENNIPALTIYKKAGFRVVNRNCLENSGFELEMSITDEIFRRANFMLINSIKISETWGGVKESKNTNSNSIKFTLNYWFVGRTAA